MSLVLSDLEADTVSSGVGDKEIVRVFVEDFVPPVLVSDKLSETVRETESSLVPDIVAERREMVMVSSADTEMEGVFFVLDGVGGGVNVREAVASTEMDCVSVKVFVPEGFLKTRASVKEELT